MITGQLNCGSDVQGRCDDCGAPAGEFHEPHCRYIKQPVDAINPSHYRQGGIEAIDALEASMTREEHIGYLKGQVMRYLWRLGRKDDPAQEAGKALWYAERLKTFLSK